MNVRCGVLTDSLAAPCVGIAAAEMLADCLYMAMSAFNHSIVDNKMDSPLFRSRKECLLLCP